MPGATPIFGFPYPDPSDLVANYPALGQQLAEDVETEILASGKVLQIVRATDATNRTTTSTSLVDASLSVTITPTKNTSDVLLIWSSFAAANGNSNTDVRQFHAITDNSNNVISGAESARFGTINATSSGTLTQSQQATVIAYATPGTTSATTFKARFASAVATTNAQLNNSFCTAQLFAIEVSP
jgi:hypothetical protein